jgi:hypothetical protein
VAVTFEEMTSDQSLDLQPWNTVLTLEPHACEICKNCVLDPNIAETEEVGLRTHKYVVCNFAEQLMLSMRGQPTKCGLIRHHLEHRGPALEDAVQRGIGKHNPNLVLEIHSFDGNGYDIRTAYTMMWGHRLAEFDVYAIEGNHHRLSFC